VHVAAIQSWMRFARTAQSAAPDSRPLAHAPPDHAPPAPPRRGPAAALSSRARSRLCADRRRRCRGHPHSS
jgi:hypothetical protein